MTFSWERGIKAEWKRKSSRFTIALKFIFEFKVLGFFNAKGIFYSSLYFTIQSAIVTVGKTSTASGIQCVWPSRIADLTDTQNGGTFQSCGTDGHSRRGTDGHSCVAGLTDIPASRD